MNDWSLVQKQSLPLEGKIILAQRRIREWYEHWDGMVDVSFSGGYDSTVLLHLVRSMYPDVPAVFVDTGLEFPEIREFVRSFENVVWLKPKMSFTEVLRRYGYPVVSKDQACAISRYNCTKDPIQKFRRLNGWPNGKKGMISAKWQYLLDAPFKISDECCNVMKIQPIKTYRKISGRQGFTGVMAGDSKKRRAQYSKQGCNSFDGKEPASRPLSIWTKADVQEYTRLFNVQQCSVYEMGYDRTGCVFCMFGCHMEPAPGRFALLKKTHPQLHKYCMNQLGLHYILNYLGVPYE
jgi:3'-phosphoadenosine 5'-phosphosulfate sulfotransferase (PAPS reductase)/FAD synthetase